MLWSLFDDKFVSKVKRQIWMYPGLMVCTDANTTWLGAGLLSPGAYFKPFFPVVPAGLHQKSLYLQFVRVGTHSCWGHALGPRE